MIPYGTVPPAVETQLTDAVRVAVCQELWAYWYKSGAVLFDTAINRYEAEAKWRMSERGER